MRKLKRSTARDVMVFLTDASDHVTGIEGVGGSVVVTASKAGGAFAGIAPVVTERGDGWYSLALTAAMTDTPGDLALHIEATGADPVDTLMEVDPLQGAIVRENTAQGGAAGSITLDAGASATDDLYKGLTVRIIAGTGAGQARQVVGYTGATKIATVAALNWTTAPDNTSVFQLVAERASDYDFLGVSYYASYLPLILADTDDIQTRIPAALVGGRMDSSVGAMAANVVTAAAIATGAIDADALAADAVAEIAAAITVPSAASVADAVWDELSAGHLTTGSYGEMMAILHGLSNGMYVVDTTTNGVNGMTAARLRVFTDAADVIAATDGGVAEGELAAFNVECTFEGPGKITIYKAYRIS